MHQQQTDKKLKDLDNKKERTLNGYATFFTGVCVGYDLVFGYLALDMTQTAAMVVVLMVITTWTSIINLVLVWRK